MAKCLLLSLWCLSLLGCKGSILSFAFFYFFDFLQLFQSYFFLLFFCFILHRSTRVFLVSASVLCIRWCLLPFSLPYFPVLRLLYFVSAFFVIIQVLRFLFLLHLFPLSFSFFSCRYSCHSCLLRFFDACYFRHRFFYHTNSFSFTIFTVRVIVFSIFSLYFTSFCRGLFVLA